MFFVVAYFSYHKNKRTGGDRRRQEGKGGVYSYTVICLEIWRFAFYLSMNFTQNILKK